MTVVCLEQNHRVPEDESLTVHKSGGGNYRRPARGYRRTICIRCAVRIEARMPEPVPGGLRAASGHTTYSQYGIVSMRLALGRWAERYGADRLQAIKDEVLS